MIYRLIQFSVQQKLLIGLLIAGLLIAGLLSMRQLAVDAVPDITNNQVQVVTVSPSLAPQEVEQFITLPIEVALANLPRKQEIRSISRFGLSVVTVVFDENMPILEARQLVRELLEGATSSIPEGLGQPELMPITTGLGEIYQYVLRVRPGYEGRYDAMELRTIQDWIVKRQMAGITGIIEISSFGGYLKQYEVAIDPVLLQSVDLSIAEVFDALAKNNQNSGGSYIEKTTNAFYIRTEGLAKSLDDIGKIVVGVREGNPVLVRDIAQLRLGSPNRFGAMTMDGKGEAVGGITLMLKGANSSEAIQNVRQRVKEVQKSLPEGIELYPYLDRANLVSKTIHTVKTNLLEGGIIVIFVLILLLGNLRAGLIVASVIPLAMLFGIILMHAFGVSANLMSLGAIDFGIVVDGAVIVVEGVLHALVAYFAGKTLTRSEMDQVVTKSSAELFRSAFFGVIIILVVFIPVMTLTGVEGKMFRPMALSFSFVILGALLLSLTYVPMMASLALSRKISTRPTFADRLMQVFRKGYRPILESALAWPKTTIGISFSFLLVALLIFSRMGSEFIPTLEEGDLAMQMTIQPGSTLSESVRTSSKAEKILLDNFPEVQHVVSKIGTAEVPTDPMAVEDADIMIVMKPREEWTSAHTREALVDKMKAKLEVIPGASFEFTQPIQLRFNELMTGAKTDIAIKIFGEDTDILKKLADQAGELVAHIPGAGDVKVEQTEGFPQLVVQYNRERIAEHGLNIEELNTLVRTAFAGTSAGVVFENERQFDLVVRLQEAYRKDLNLGLLFIHLPDGRTLPLSEVAEVSYKEGPMMISREEARRRINVGINVRNRDVASLVADIEKTLDEKLPLPPGYTISYGGQFENLEAARARLSIAVPIALGMIFILLFFTFGTAKYALMIFSAVPLSAIGGILALWLRGMPFSISAGIGFIALFGVAVLNGIVLISFFNQDLKDDDEQHLRDVIIRGSLTRLRPIIMTATVAALGFIPMATSTSNGAEVQKPLATVVIGGLVTSTLLTLVVLPALYLMVNRRKRNPITPSAAAIGVLLTLGLLNPFQTQAQGIPLTLPLALQNAHTRHPALQAAEIQTQAAARSADQARYLPPTQFQLNGGQMNTGAIDYLLSFSQSLGNPAADKQKLALARSNTTLKAQEKKLLEYQLDREITLKWLDWLYKGHQLQLLKYQLRLFESLQQKTTLLYQNGDADLLEKSLADNKYALATQKVHQAETETMLALQELRRTAFLDGVWELPAGDYPLLALPIDTSAGNELRQTGVLQVEIAQHQVQLQQKLIAPEWNFGYTAVSLRPDGYFFQTLTTGVSIPLFRKYWKAGTDIARLQQLATEADLNALEFQIARQRESSAAQLRLIIDLLNTQGDSLLKQAQQLRTLAELRIQSGETDYFQIFLSLESAVQSELEHLNLLHRFNMALTDWTYWRH